MTSRAIATVVVAAAAEPCGLPARERGLLGAGPVAPPPFAPPMAPPTAPPMAPPRG